MSITVTIGTSYLVILLECLTFAFIVTIVGFIIPGRSRKENFHFEMLAEFADEHKKAFGPDAKVDSTGYPDNGQGRYSKKFTYKEWFDFNCA